MTKTRRVTPRLVVPPAVSVIMPVHNGMPFLPSALGSIQCQSLRDCEIIIVNDGSTDTSLDFLRSAARSDPRLCVIDQAKSGIVGALEAARKAARAPFVARMDADDLALEERLASQVAFLKRNPRTVVVGTQTILIDHSGNRVGYGRYPIGPEACRQHLSSAAPVCHPAVMLRADALSSVGGYRTICEPAEDLDLWLRLVRIGTIDNHSSALLNYRRHSQATTVRRARRNARATAIAFLADRFPDYISSGKLKVDLPWSETEPQLDPGHRCWARFAYLRALVLNGGASEHDLSHIAARLKDFKQDPIIRSNRRALAFTIVRGIKHGLSKGYTRETRRLVTAAGVHCSVEAIQELFRSALSVAIRDLD